MKHLMLLKTVVLFLVPALFLVLNETKSEAAFEIPNVSEISSETVFADEREIHKLINKQRRKKGLDDLQWSGDLERLARNYSQKMADGKFFSHYDRNGDSIVQRAGKMRIKGWRKIGENLFYSQPYKKLNELAVEKWMQSPSHRENILDRNYNTTGIGIAQARDGSIYITQVFTQN